MSNSVTEVKIQAFREISRQYSDTSSLMHEAIARHVGLSGTDHKYLGLLMQKGEMTAGEFSRLTGLTTGAVTGLVDRLEIMGLAGRRFDQQDRRRVMVVPNTLNALNLLSPVFSRLNEKTTNLVATFSAPEIAVLERYFLAAIDIMNELTDQLKSE